MTDRVAVVTGAAAGIGRAVTNVLAAAGYRLALWDLPGAATDGLVDEFGSRAQVMMLDVADDAAVTDAAATVQRRVGTPDAVVTAAGIMRSSPFLQLRTEDWQRTLQVNLTGTFNVMQACARLMVADRVPGSMVAVASVAARGPRPDAADYAASKAAVVSLVRSAAVALAEHGIRVNAICPGMVDTAMTTRNAERRAAATATTPAHVLETMLERVALRRLAAPSEIASVAARLIDDDFGYVTGQAINVCGGLEFD